MAVVSVPVGLAAVLWAIIGATALATPSPSLSPADGAAIVAAVRSAASEGLVSSDVTLDANGLSSADPSARAAADAALSRAAVGLAAAQHGVLQQPRTIDRAFALRMPYDAVADFNAARRADRIQSWLQGLERRDSQYVALVRARRKYADILGAGGWRRLADAGPLSLGARGAAVAALRERLGAEGYDASLAAEPDVFDQPLTDALAAFQAAHELPPNGALDGATRAELNVSATDRLATIDANLERERWLPNPLPAVRIEVDIATAMAKVLPAGRDPVEMRVIVGDARHHTPLLASAIRSIVFNPPWIVPADITSAELLPLERRSPGYLARGGFHWVGGRLVQRPGPKAALGALKFEIESPFDVYLHDTPARNLFARNDRRLSHGCVRLERPRELATLLLADQGWRDGDVDAAIARRRTERLALRTPMPVFLVYRTVEIDSKGGVLFHRDVYGWDALLISHLRR